MSGRAAAACRRRRLALCFCCLLAAAAPGQARAAGIETPDAGAVGLGRAGAMAARPDLSLALRYNPAGLAFQPGLRGDVQGVVSYQRVRFDPGNGSFAANSFLPWAFPTGGGLSMGFGARGPFRAVTFALGATAPSAGAARMRFAADGPQRYSLIDSNLLVVYPTVAVAVGVTPWLSLGIAGQMAYSQIQVSLAARPVTGTVRQLDALATVAVQGGLQPTGIVGVTVTPTSRLAIGASYRPPLGLAADGTLAATIPTAAGGLGVVQHNQGVTLSMTLPQVLRVGVELRPIEMLALEANYVYEGWSALDAIHIAMHGVTFTTAQGISAVMPDVSLPQQFVDAHSARVGVELTLAGGHLALRAGGALETSAVPLASTSVLFPNWGTQMLTAGLSLGAFGMHLDVGFGHGITPTRVVTRSITRQVVTPNLVDATAPGASPLVVGNGTYQSALDVVAIGLRFALEDLGQPPRPAGGGAEDGDAAPAAATGDD